MKKFERVVKKYYEGLDEGKILAFKCKRCGEYTFPPVYACAKCSGTDMEWMEISGEAKLINFAMPGGMGVAPENQPLLPYGLGFVELSEGPRFSAMVLGLSNENRKEIADHLPVPVKAEMVQRDGFKTIVFRLKG